MSKIIWEKGSCASTDREIKILGTGRLHRKSNTICLLTQTGEEYFPIEGVDAVSIFGNLDVSLPILSLLNEKGVSVNLADNFGKYIGRFIPANSNKGNVTLLKQAELYLNPALRLNVAKKIVKASIFNLRANLRYYQKLRKSVLLKQSGELLTVYLKKVDEISDYSKLLMQEARARQEYYSSFGEIIRNPDFHFSGRSKRPPKDEINAMISFGNTLLYNKLAIEILQTNLDIRFPNLHALGNRPQSLELDLSEMFKPLVVDRLIFSLINHHTLQVNQHFQRIEKNGVYLSAKGKALFIKSFDAELHKTRKSKWGDETTYLKLIRDEVKAYARMVETQTNYQAYRISD